MAENNCIISTNFLEIFHRLQYTLRSAISPNTYLQKYEEDFHND